MKKKILTVLLAVVAALCLCFGLAACGDTPKDPASGTQTEQGSTDGSEDNGGNQDGDKETEGDEDEGGSEEDGGDKQPDEGGEGTGGDKNPDEGGQGGSEGEDGNTPDEGGQGGEVQTCAHQYTVENVCSLCGDKWEYTEGLNYELDKTTDTYAVGENSNVSGDIVIPYGYQGKFVTKINSYAFEGCNGMTGITIPDSVTFIGEEVFYNCSGLTNIFIPDSVTSIYWYAFKGTAYYNDPSHWDADGVLYIGNHLIGAKDTISGAYAIKSGTKTIAGAAFEDCSELTSIEIPDGVISIELYAFGGCSELTNINIPDSVISIGYSAFEGTAYYDDPSHWDEDGVLYIDGHLIRVKSTLSGAYTVRAGTKTIAAEAFSDCSGLTSIVIPDSVVSIGMGAFGECTGLKEATIGRGVSSMDGHVFYECTGLENITVDVNNSSYSSQDGVLYNKEQTMIVHVPKAIKGEVIIPNGVTEIENRSYVEGRSGETFVSCEGLTSIVIPDSVTLIETSAFYGCTGLTSVTIGSGVTEIGDRAFEFCSGLTGVYITDLAAWCKINFGYNYGNPLYYAKHLYMNGAEVKNLTIPASVTKIGSYAFEGCSGLESVTIGSGVTEIGRYAFYNCSGLESITVDINNKNYSSQDGILYNKEKTQIVKVPQGIKGAVTLPDSVTEIGNYTFQYCRGLPSVTIPNSVTEIGRGAFSGCIALESVTIGSGVTSIGDEAFYSCSGLEHITVAEGNPVYRSEQDCLIERQSNTLVLGCKNSVIPDGVTKIGDYAFHGYSGLTSIAIPDSVTEIGRYAFYGCSGLTSIVVEPNNPNYSSQDGILYNKEKTKIVQVPKAIKGAVTLPDSVTEIGDSAFYGCSGLTSIVIPDSVTKIGNEAFYECSGLESVTIGSGVTKIVDLAFYNCSGLEHITVAEGNVAYRSEQDCLIARQSNTLILGCKNSVIPDSVTAIGWYAFHGCSGLTSIEIPDSVTEIGWEAFSGCTALESVTIGSGVTVIGKYAFCDCGALTDIQFKGTVEEWQAIEEESYWDSGTGNYTVTCTDGTVDKMGYVTYFNN